MNAKNEVFRTEKANEVFGCIAQLQSVIAKQTKKELPLNNSFFLVGLPGFEPRQTEPKTVVLPLHNNPIP